MRALVCWLVVGAGLVLADTAVACTSDMDCKGDRICSKSECRAPGRSCRLDEDCELGARCLDAQCLSRPADQRMVRQLVVPSSILVLPFRDHQSSDPRDSVDTGLYAQKSFFKSLGKIKGLTVLVSEYSLRTARQGWSRAGALAVASEHKVDAVVYGEVTDFYRVAPFTVRNDRAAVWVEVVTASGEILFRRETRLQLNTNHIEPTRLLDMMADDIVKMIAPPKRRRKKP